jgi:glycosyltransferase involved in cell wall biosynthesis
MVGKGQLYEETRSLVEKLQLKNIEFYPDANESNARELLQGGDVFLGFMETNSTILREIPNKVYQGLALKKIVITGDSPAIRTVFENEKNIVLVPPGSGAELAKEILKLTKSRAKAKKIAEAGYVLYKENFTPKAVGAVLKQAFVNVL